MMCEHIAANATQASCSIADHQMCIDCSIETVKLAIEPNSGISYRDLAGSMRFDTCGHYGENVCHIDYSGLVAGLVRLWAELKMIKGEKTRSNRLSAAIRSILAHHGPVAFLGHSSPSR